MAHVVLPSSVMPVTSDKPTGVVARVPSGRLALDGKALVSADSEAIRHRHRMSFHGVILVSLVVDKAGKPLVPAKVSLDGLLDEPAAGDAVAAIADEIADAMDDMPKAKRGDDAELTEAVRLAARRWFNKTYDKKPVTKVHLIRV